MNSAGEVLANRAAYGIDMPVSQLQLCVKTLGRYVSQAQAGRTCKAEMHICLATSPPPPGPNQTLRAVISHKENRRVNDVTMNKLALTPFQQTVFHNPSRA